MLSCLETLVGHVIYLKGLIAAAFQSSALSYLGLMGVSAPSLHRESTDSLILCNVIMHKRPRKGYESFHRLLWYTPFTCALVLTSTCTQQYRG